MAKTLYLILTPKTVLNISGRHKQRRPFALLNHGNFPVIWGPYTRLGIRKSGEKFRNLLLKFEVLQKSQKFIEFRKIDILKVSLKTTAVSVGNVSY